MASEAEIETVARALREVIAQRIWAVSKVTGPPTPFDDLAPFWQGCYRAEAKAAIEAIDRLRATPPDTQGAERA